MLQACDGAWMGVRRIESSSMAVRRTGMLCAYVSFAEFVLCTAMGCAGTVILS